MNKSDYIDRNNITNRRKVDYAYLNQKIEILKKAYRNSNKVNKQYQEFLREFSWVNDYALYNGLKERTGKS
mgnify:CR=1 FL=1